ncbi:MAG: hypothetical protein AB7Q37_05855 [Pyrinomonadaceae bacterium]
MSEKLKKRKLIRGSFPRVADLKSAALSFGDHNEVTQRGSISEHDSERAFSQQKRDISTFDYRAEPLFALFSGIDFVQEIRQGADAGRFSYYIKYFLLRNRNSSRPEQHFARCGYTR